MKLLLINPNTSDSVSDLIRAEAERSAAPGTHIEVLTAPFDVAYTTDPPPPPLRAATEVTLTIEPDP